MAQKYAALGKGASDVFKMLSVVGAYEYEGGKDSFCEANFVRTKVSLFLAESSYPFDSSSPAITPL